MIGRRAMLLHMRIWMICVRIVSEWVMEKWMMMTLVAGMFAIVWLRMCLVMRWE